MRERLTASGLATLDRALRFGDLVILPSEIGIRTQTKTGAKLVKESWVRRRFAARPDRLKMPWIALEELRQEYEAHRHMTHQEPRWASRLPKEAKRHFRFSHYLGDGFEPLAIVLNIPYTGIGYAVEEDGLIEDAMHAFGVLRLGGIRQLAFLHDPLSEGLAMRFDHTRYCHVLDVMVLATLMAVRNKVPASARRALRVAAFTHDVMTPAGGDTTKIVDRNAFDEDLHYAEIFERREAEIEPFLRRHRLTKQRLTDIVHNKGVLGQLLDLADKMAYVGRDAAMYVQQVHPTVFKERNRYPPSYRRMRHLVFREFPQICGIWDSVIIADGKVVVTDGERLGAFLELRARLFRDLYYNPASRFLEHTVSSIVMRDLYQTGALTRDRLLNMQDFELDTMFEKITGMRRISGMLFGQDHAFVETFKTREEAERREDELELTGEHIVLLEEFVGATGTGTKLLTWKDGAIKPFSEAYPERTELIADIMRNRKPYRLYYFPVERVFTPWFRAAVARYRARRAEAKRSGQHK